MAAIESAIPEHLRRERACPVAMRENWVPPYPSFSARFDPEMKQLTVLILGVQVPYGDASRRDMHAYSQSFVASIEHGMGVLYWDQSEFIDRAGLSNRMIICYLDAGEQELGIADGLRRDWLEPASGCAGWGFYAEEIRPTLDRVETLYSSDHVQGVAHLAESLSGEIQEHGYWGSARDRMPIAQTDPMKPADGVAEGPPNGTVVRDIDNLCLIRSGQDWSQTQGEERRMYLEEVEPTLRAGMDYLTADGREIGCIDNRYARVLDESGNVIDQSYGFSWWNSMAELDDWAREHPTHKAIFGVAMRYLNEHGGSGHLKLTHEVFVVDRAQGRFEYRNCHAETGLMAGARR
ncbi:MAG: phenylacetaldoxime dehydratase family protein [Pseudoclavibacter sp.]